MANISQKNCSKVPKNEFVNSPITELKNIILKNNSIFFPGVTSYKLQALRHNRMENSILDKLIESKHWEEAHQFNPVELINDLFRPLKDLEREVLVRRFNLNNKGLETLEQIGKTHEITRERVRQIQNSAILKIKTLTDFKENLAAVINTTNNLIKEHGGLMEDAHFLEKMLIYSEDNPTNRQAILFITSQLIDDQIERVKPDEKILSGWKLKVLSLENIYQVLDILEKIVAEQNKLLVMEEIINHFKNHNFFQDNREQFLPFYATATDKVIDSYLRISKRINTNILNQWGLTEWQTISPRRMGDKIYLILKKQQKPLHFTEITNLINEVKFDAKIAYSATIHNELILDDRYVLVGRGIYALREWGYQPGTVLQVVENILRHADRPLTKSEILDKVLKERMVKESTVHLALTNKEKFKKMDGGYVLAEMNNEKCKMNNDCNH